jgi:hypothetical protein
MKKKIIVIFTIMMFLTTTFTMNGIAISKEEYEITDIIGDTDLGLLDIESAWFYENQDEPEYLFTALKIKDLKESFNAIFSIRWMYNNEEYVSGLDTFFYREKVFRCGLPQRASYLQWKNMPECEGNFDVDAGIITWKILKTNIGNPVKGDELIQTRANAVPGFPVSFLYFFTGRDYRDFAPDNIGEYGLNYIIKY